MKRSIKNRIAAALFLAASLGGHNYKTAAVDHVDSRKLKNNKQSTSLPLLAKIGIPVGLVSVLGLGYHHLNKPKYMFEQDKYKLSEKSRELDEGIRTQNFELMIKSAKNNEQKALVEAFAEIAEKLKGLSHAAAEEKLFIKCKRFSFSDFVDKKKATFEENNIEKSPENLYISGKQYQLYKQQPEKINLQSFTDFRANVVKTGFSTLLGAICGHCEIDDQDFEINDSYINFFEDKPLVMAKCSLDISKGLLTIECDHHKINKQNKNSKQLIAKVISVFDVSEWIKR